MTPRRRLPPWRGVALAAAYCIAGALAAGDARAVDPEASLQRELASVQLLEQARNRLPPSWPAHALSGISVQWRDDLPPAVHGRALGKTLLLRQSLLGEWMTRPPGAGDEHPATRAALATVIHELAHVLDRSSGNALSRNPRFLDLAGWQVHPLASGGRRARNDFSDRSVDAYELESPAEFLAVNLEHFLLDPGYACRRPELHRHFADHFGWTPPATVDCAADAVVVQAGEYAPEESLLAIDPSRIHAVDYLLAEGNGQPMSRWGHSMLRLVVCAPGRAPGPDCRLDLQHHQVLSFRAFVDDLQLSSWRGLAGSYPSRLFVLPLQQVVDEYTKVELRGLQSIPLRLHAAEIASLVERAAQLHWSYDGRYYFVSNNCAVETFKLLHDGVPRLAGAGLGSITPTGLLRRLQRAGIADASVLQDRDLALRLGYRFDAMSERYQAMFEVARAALPIPTASVGAWLDLEPTTREPWIARADLQASAAMLVLEQAALRRQELLARDELKRRFLRRRPGGAESAVAIALGELLQLEGLLSRPALLIPDGYGLPQAQERVALAEVSTAGASRLRQRAEALRELGRDALAPQRVQALSQTEANLVALGERLRTLHRDQGGLQLR